MDTLYLQAQQILIFTCISLISPSQRHIHEISRFFITCFVLSTHLLLKLVCKKVYMPLRDNL